MKRRMIGALLGTLTLWVAVAEAVLPSSDVHIVEKSAKPLITEADRDHLERKLAICEREQGLRVLLQVHERSPSAEEDKVPGAYMRNLSESLGTAVEGVLVVYFADEDDWRIWFGDAVAPRFVGRNATAQELTENGAIHEAKEALLNESRAAADAVAAKLASSSTEESRRPNPTRLRLQTDSLLDRLFQKLARK